MKYGLSILSFILALSLVYVSKNQITETAKDNTIAYKDSAPLYLPRINAVKSVTLGYEHTVSTLLWFSTLNYFGEKFQEKKSMPWFSHMCELVTELDPKGKHVFEFCGTLLSWIARQPGRSIAILSKGIESDPDYWRYYYLRGFSYWYFLEDFDRARSDFEYAARIPGAPTFLASLASRLIVAGGDVKSAIAFLRAGIETSSDEVAKAALEDRLKLAYVSRDIEAIEEIIQNYKLKSGTYPESLESLVHESYFSMLPVDPYGDVYQYNFETKEVTSLQGKKGLHFPGKTAKTGIASKEGWISNE